MTQVVDTNLIDRWTTVHALTGYALGAFGVPAGVTFVTGILYELLEYTNDRSKKPILALPRSPESVPNAVADVVLYQGAYYIARNGGYQPIHGAAALGLAAGLGLALMPSSDYVR